VIRASSLLVVAALLAACSGDVSDSGSRSHAPTTASASPRPRSCAKVENLGGAASAYAASILRPTAAFGRPSGAVIARFGRLNVNGVPMIFSVRAVVRGRDCRPAWYFAQLPIRPNGATGYLPAADLAVYRVDTRVVVDLSSRRLDMFRGGHRLLSVTTAVGSSATPTPTGRFYMNQRLYSENPDGPYGPGAIGISAFSPVLTGWAQGGPIAIHGTNRPDSIGRPVTNGCLRIANEVLLRLFKATKNGTPVVIRA
jgi:lipoprotein-anchoring transpeptidase ErfK/SrfK